MALWARRPPQVLQLAHRLQHSGHGELARVVAEADVRAPAVVDVGVEGAGQIHSLRVGEGGAVMRRSDLERRD